MEAVISARRWILTAYWLIPVAVLLSVWAPVISHYHVSATPVSTASIEALRTSPPDTLLHELGTAKHALIPPIGRLISDPVAEAEFILEQFKSATSNDRQFSEPLVNPDLLGNLDYAMLVVPRTLLAAYEATRNEVYFDAARRFILEWSELERRRWIPAGLLWNDHAIAARAITYSEFWRLYRGHAAFDPDEARDFLNLVVASAMRLADPGHYTHASNHGTMQNVALMHFGLAFPSLDGFESLGELGMTRQLEQIAYMVSPEGFVLEHSAGYHRLGMELMGIALRYQTLLGKALPTELVDKYRRAREIYALLAGPDGRLPPIGDTSASLTAPAPLTTEIDDSGLATALRRTQDSRRASNSAVYADAGHAIWWSQTDSEDLATQSTVSWSRFPRHGHKHADELSLNIRTGDVRWWTSVGYWPLNHSQRLEAESWSGSNAPHRVDESPDSLRQSELLGSAATNKMHVIDARRSGPEDFSVRRQVVFVEPDVWIIIDAITDSPGRLARVVWGTTAENRIRQKPGPDAYEVVPPGENPSLQTFILSSEPVKTTVLRGSDNPFAGWVEDKYTAAPADAIVAEVPSASSWLANVSVLHASRANDEAAVRVLPEWTDAEHWQIGINDGRRSMLVRREGQEIVASGAALPSPSRVQLREVPVTENWHRQSQARFEDAESRYATGFADLLPYRLQVSAVIFGLLLLQMVVIAITRRVVPAQLPDLRILSTLAWLAVAAWVHLAYLKL